MRPFYLSHSREPFKEWLSQQTDVFTNEKSVGSYVSYMFHSENNATYRGSICARLKDGKTLLETVEDAFEKYALKGSIDAFLIVSEQLQMMLSEVAKTIKEERGSPSSVGHIRSALRSYTEFLLTHADADTDTDATDIVPDKTEYIKKSSAGVIVQSIDEVSETFVTRLRTQNRFGNSDKKVYMPISFISKLCNAAAPFYGRLLLRHWKDAILDTVFATTDGQMHTVRDVKEFAFEKDGTVRASIKGSKEYATLAASISATDEPMHATDISELTLDHIRPIDKILQMDLFPQLRKLTDAWDKKAAELKMPKSDYKKVGAMTLFEEIDFDILALIGEVKAANSLCGMQLLNRADNLRKRNN